MQSDVICAKVLHNRSKILRFVPQKLRKSFANENPMPGPVYGDSSIKPEILGLDLAFSGGIYILGFPRGSDSLSDTNLLQEVDLYAKVSDMLEEITQ